ncbi:hypothetical protein ASF11_15910 [Acidovorax sp. Leaf76]|nr:hypothetical protein ASF11_15910 [Acidovorax sp. Leaf76]KQO30128.1 hypothetical protein ASF19_13590 [Acidovorax sp. Leaf84]KQS28804.1 hypothetical protein ASG27_10950 [Acidovorax sp. Leaf191]
MIAALQGEVLALRVGVSALLLSMSESQRPDFAKSLFALGEHTKAVQLSTPVPEPLIDAFDELLRSMQSQGAPS